MTLVDDGMWAIREEAIAVNGSQSIVAGYDGSSTSRHAVEYAAAAADAYSLALRIIHCYAWSPTEGHQAEIARRQLAELIDNLIPLYPRLSIRSLLVARSPAVTLIDESRNASMVVVANEGAGTFGDIHTGAVARQVASQALCPVVVIRGPTSHLAETTAAPTTQPVLLAIDADISEPDAIVIALAEAKRLGAPLRVFCLPSRSDRVSRAPDRILTPWQHRNQEVSLTSEVTPRAEAAERLLTASSEARLLIIGAKAAGTERGVRVGSLYGPLLSTADCPVMIAHGSGVDVAMTRPPAVMPVPKAA
jgi:nucleotide-binding universal stress UspA family protein